MGYETVQRIKGKDPSLEGSIGEAEKNLTQFLKFRAGPYFLNTSDSTTDHVAGVNQVPLFTIEGDELIINFSEGLVIYIGDAWKAIKEGTRLNVRSFNTAYLCIRTPIGAVENPYSAFLALPNKLFELLHGSFKDQEPLEVIEMGTILFGKLYNRSDFRPANQSISKSLNAGVVLQPDGIPYLMIGKSTNIEVTTSLENERVDYNGPINLAGCTYFTLYAGNNRYRFDLPKIKKEGPNYEYLPGQPIQTFVTTIQELDLSKLPEESRDLLHIFQSAETSRTKICSIKLDYWNQLLQPLILEQLLTPGIDKLILNFDCRGETGTVIIHQKFMPLILNGKIQSGSMPFVETDSGFDRIFSNVPLQVEVAGTNGVCRTVHFSVQVPKETGAEYSSTEIVSIPVLTPEAQERFNNAKSDAEGQAILDEFTRQAGDYIRSLTPIELCQAVLSRGELNFQSGFVAGLDFQRAKDYHRMLVAAIMSHILTKILLPEVEVDPFWFAGDGANAPTGGLLPFLKKRKEVETFLQRLTAALKIIKPEFNGQLLIRMMHTFGFDKGLTEDPMAFSKALAMAGNLDQSTLKTYQEIFDSLNLARTAISLNSLKVLNAKFDEIWGYLEYEISCKKALGNTANADRLQKASQGLSFLKGRWDAIKAKYLLPVMTTVYDGTTKKTVGEELSHLRYFITNPNELLAEYEQFIRYVQKLSEAYGIDISKYNL